MCGHLINANNSYNGHRLKVQHYPTIVALVFSTAFCVMNLNSKSL